MPLTSHEQRILDDIGARLTRTRRVGLLKPGPGTHWRMLLWLRAAGPMLVLLVVAAAGIVGAALLMPAAVAAVVAALLGALGVLALQRIRELVSPGRR